MKYKPYQFRKLFSYAVGAMFHDYPHYKDNPDGCAVLTIQRQTLFSGQPIVGARTLIADRFAGWYNECRIDNPEFYQEYFNYIFCDPENQGK